MRKNILIIFLLFFCMQIFAQSTMHNLKKYWYYRDRLEEDFMIVGQPELQGTNFPASARHNNQYRKMGFGGENPIKGQFGPWLCVLATEYRLLKDYGQNEKAAEALQRIAWALYSFDRLDMNTEKIYRARSGGLAYDDPDFWEKVDDCMAEKTLSELIYTNNSLTII